MRLLPPEDGRKPASGRQPVPPHFTVELSRHRYARPQRTYYFLLAPRHRHIYRISPRGPLSDGRVTPHVKACLKAFDDFFLAFMRELDTASRSMFLFYIFQTCFCRFIMPRWPGQRQSYQSRRTASVFVFISFFSQCYSAGRLVAHALSRRATVRFFTRTGRHAH